MPAGGLIRRTAHLRSPRLRQPCGNDRSDHGENGNRSVDLHRRLTSRPCPDPVTRQRSEVYAGSRPNGRTAIPAMCRPAGIRQRTTANAAMACQYRRDFASSQVAKKLAASKTASRTAAPLSGVRCRVKNGPSLTCHRVPPVTWWTCSRGSVVPGRCVSGRSRTGPVMRPHMSARYCADGRRPAPTPPPGSRKRSVRTT